MLFFGVTNNYLSIFTSLLLDFVCTGNIRLNTVIVARRDVNETQES